MAKPEIMEAEIFVVGREDGDMEVCLWLSPLMKEDRFCGCTPGSCGGIAF